MYYEFSELVYKLPSHRILAINRGENEQFLKVYIQKPQDKILYYMQKDIIKGDSQFKLMLENTNPTETINIIGKEYNILLILLNSHESIISKEQLFSKVWGYDSDSEINTLEAYMSFIRKKLKNINSKVKIKVIRNIGYKLEYQNEKIKI